MAIDYDLNRFDKQVRREQLFDGLINEVYEINSANGWFDKERSFGDEIALLHSEVSEALEGYRTGDMDNVVEEFADVLIRLVDTFKRQNITGYDISKALEMKMSKNRARGYRHGGKAL